MSIADRNKVVELEGKVTQLEQRLEDVVRRLGELESRPLMELDMEDPAVQAEIEDQKRAALIEPRKPVKMCPHCNKVPAKFFHVRSCPEKK